MATWSSPEDVNQDLMLFSEISGHSDDQVEPPPDTILQYEARIGANNTSIFDTPALNDDVIYLSSGRGRGGVSKFFKLGLPIKKKEIEEDEQLVYKKIREVSGLGYSNELIEKSFRKVTKLPIEEEFCDAPENEDIKLKLCVHETLANVHGSTNVPLSKSPNNMSSSGSTLSFSPLAFGPEEDVADSHSADRPTCSSLNPSPVNVNPPPLSVIMSKGKQKMPPKLSPPNIKKLSLKTNEVSLKPHEKENSVSGKDNPYENQNNVHEGTPSSKYTLNPEAPEFKCSGKASPESAQHILVTKPQSRNFSLTNMNVSNENSFVEDLNLPSTSKEPFPRRPLSGRDFYRSETDWSSFNQNKNWYTNDVPFMWEIPENPNKFDIKSNDDFPAL